MTRVVFLPEKLILDEVFERDVLRSCKFFMKGSDISPSEEFGSELFDKLTKMRRNANVIGQYEHEHQDKFVINLYDEINRAQLDTTIDEHICINSTSMLLQQITLILHSYFFKEDSNVLFVSSYFDNENYYRLKNCVDVRDTSSTTRFGYAYYIETSLAFDDMMQNFGYVGVYSDNGTTLYVNSNYYNVNIRPSYDSAQTFFTEIEYYTGFKLQKFDQYFVNKVHINPNQKRLSRRQFNLLVQYLIPKNEWIRSLSMECLYSFPTGSI